MANLWVRKSITKLQAEAAESHAHSLKRTLSATNLVTLGIGAIIGAGFFVAAMAVEDRAAIVMGHGVFRVEP